MPLLLPLIVLVLPVETVMSIDESYMAHQQRAYELLLDLVDPDGNHPSIHLRYDNTLRAIVEADVVILISPIDLMQDRGQILKWARDRILKLRQSENVRQVLMVSFTNMAFDDRCDPGITVDQDELILVNPSHDKLFQVLKTFQKKLSVKKS